MRKRLSIDRRKRLYMATAVVGGVPPPSIFVWFWSCLVLSSLCLLSGLLFSCLVLSCFGSACLFLSSLSQVPPTPSPLQQPMRHPKSARKAPEGPMEEFEKGLLLSCFAFSCLALFCFVLSWLCLSCLVLALLVFS